MFTICMCNMAGLPVVPLIWSQPFFIHSVCPDTSALLVTKAKQMVAKVKQMVIEGGVGNMKTLK